MKHLTTEPRSARGIGICAKHESARSRLPAIIERYGLEKAVSYRESGQALHASLSCAAADAIAPAADTLQLANRLGSHTTCPDNSIGREILAAMLSSPVLLAFPSIEEFESAIRIRQRIIEAAQKTELAFDTRSVERPIDCWRYSEECGFTVLPGYPIIEALTKATQPDASGKRYAFSCYRATEYLILLGIARELATANPDLLMRLQERWERKAIMSGSFHEAFLVERGSIDEPIPKCHYVPGDRIWFRNPDPVSSDVGGYEGSWVIYLGRGLFSNFWKSAAPFTLDRKCVEIFHWRHGVRQDSTGRSYIDESAVDARVCETLSDPEAVKAVLDRMMRFRDPQGVYGAGGCIDASREHPRFVHPETSDIRLDV